MSSTTPKTRETTLTMKNIPSTTRLSTTTNVLKTVTTMKTIPSTTRLSKTTNISMTQTTRKIILHTMTLSTQNASANDIYKLAGTANSSSLFPHYIAIYSLLFLVCTIIIIVIVFAYKFNVSIKKASPVGKSYIYWFT